MISAIVAAMINWTNYSTPAQEYLSLVAHARPLQPTIAMLQWLNITTRMMQHIALRVIIVIDIGEDCTI